MKKIPSAAAKIPHSQIKEVLKKKVPFISQICKTLLKFKPSLGRRVFSWDLESLVV